MEYRRESKLQASVLQRPFPVHEQPLRTLIECGLTQCPEYLTLESNVSRAVQQLPSL